MQSRAKKLCYQYLPAMFLCMLTLGSCENSLNDIKKIASKEEDRPISTSTNVEVIYSDSAKVKARMTTPLMVELDDPKNAYHEMPKGVKVVFYEDDLSVKGTITSDYAIQKDKENIIDFKKNVVVTNAQGQTFTSDELIDDVGNKKFYTYKPVEINMGNGDVMRGVGAHCNATMYPWTIDHSIGTFHVDEKDEPGKQ
ncbi:MAG TPA: LPS export ABC transporter periplasmic protein LptC [Mucilaginibacter sp.]|jgi:LPS export ABC transporter protein LptC|nr:LPS export ABC transporter periplasmic protein LptC [Mucilaginibacter sp.]